MVARLIEKMAPRVLGLDRGLQRMRVIAIREHPAGAVHDRVEPSRNRDAEPLHPERWVSRSRDVDDDEGRLQPARSALLCFNTGRRT
jgi:hypothetical protein